MEEIGMFEAKTKFSSLCDQVAKTGTPITVSRRGRPLVRITPLESAAKPDADVLAAWRRWTAEAPEDEPDFPEVWLERTPPKPSPFEDDDLAP